MFERDPNYDVRKIIDFDLDYETCVLNHHPECQYKPNSKTYLHGGHRSLVAQFCGNAEVCKNNC